MQTKTGTLLEAACRTTRKDALGLKPLMFREVKSGDARIPLLLILSQVIHAALIDVIDQASTAKLLWCMAQLGVSPPLPRWTGNDGDTNRRWISLDIYIH